MNPATKNPAARNSIPMRLAPRRKHHGYLTALVGSLTGTFVGVLTAGFLAALMLGLAGLAGTTLNTFLWLVPVPLGAALGCGGALRAGAERGAVFTALVLFALIGALSALFSVWVPLELETVWALRSVWLAALVPLTYGARGLYLIFSVQGNVSAPARKVEQGWGTPQK